MTHRIYRAVYRTLTVLLPATGRHRSLATRAQPVKRCTPQLAHPNAAAYWVTGGASRQGDNPSMTLSEVQ